MRVAVPVKLTDEQRVKLSLYGRGRSVAQRVVERARIILQAAEGSRIVRLRPGFRLDGIPWRAGGRAFWRAA